ncbi:MAG: cell division protein FtsZ [Oscillospiraceae bacterium]|nr:cell division protein FtsZ [Oscillospiraceae bacterium]
MDFKVDGPENVVNIKVIGVGGAGNNVVNRMVKNGTQGVEFIAINTDKQALAVSNADQKLQIGEKITRGQGAGSDPDIGKRSAEESRNNIAKAIENADMAFITAGMGGGTGTGAAPVVAEIARDAGLLTVGVVTKPFKFEGKRRMDQANSGIKELLSRVDSLLIIPNDRLKNATDQKVTLANAFEIADDVLLQAVTSISGLIKNTGFINLDFADVTCIMKNAGFAHMGVGHAAGKGKAEEAARMAVASPLMETSINGARGVLINITGSEDMDLDDVETAANLVQEAAHPEANIIFGASFDDSLEDEIRVTVIATGFEDNSVPAAAPAAPAANPFTPVRPTAASAAPVAPAARPQGLFSGAAEKAAAAAPVAPVLPVAPAAEKAAAAAPAEEDPFDSIFKIFNTK